MLQSDFDYIVQLMKKFFSNKKIKKYLKFIKEQEVTGWENWLQIEFSVFLDGREEVDEWYREWRYAFDKRRLNSKNHMVVDFVIRKKHALLDKYIAVELKQNSNTNECIKGMFVDLEKVNSMKESEGDIRSFWNIGVHPTVDASYMKKRINSYLTDCSIELSQRRIKTVNIKGTSFSYTVL